MKTYKKTHPTQWSIDRAHSEISFNVRDLIISHVTGSFKVFDGNVYTEKKDFTSAEIDVWIDSASIDTGDAQRDEHLKSIDFLDVVNHKHIIFTASTRQKPDEKGSLELLGELTIHGITKNLKLEVVFGGISKDLLGNKKASFTITGKINRIDWELQWNTVLDTGGFLVGEEVSILCEIALINNSQKDISIELESAVPQKNL